MDKRTIVLTLYGTGKAINDFTVTLFDGDSYSYFGGISAVEEYCSNINKLELKNDNWIYAFSAAENKKYRFEKPVRRNFDILCSLDDSSIQKVLCKVDHYALVSALISANKNILTAVLRNMSKRRAKMVIEDIENKILPKEEDIEKARDQIVEIIQHLEMTGEITVPKL